MSSLDQIQYKGMGGSSDIEKGEVDESVSVHLERKGRKGMTVEERKRTFYTKLLGAKSPLPVSCCIFKVPEVLRRQKKEAYAPDVVSIGPFHRGAKKLQLVENVKKWYLKCLLARLLPNPTGLSLKDLLESMSLDSLTESMESLAEMIKGKELDKRARGCYSDPCNHLDQNNFIDMLILDGCFLIELFRKASVLSLQDEDDPIFNVPCMLEYLYHDLLLLENQLPWFVLEFFYKKIEGGNANPLDKLVFNFFKKSVADDKILRDPDPEPSNEILHILDLIRTALVGIPDSNSTNISNIHPPQLPQRIPSATTLSEAGVIFKKSTESCILKITFNNGVFTIPPLAIDESTGPLFRNLMAFEQCYHSCKHNITSYAVLMDSLIDTNKDVDLLCEEEILANWLSADDASKFFNDLYTDTTVIDFVYKDLCKSVCEYHKAPCNKWREKLKRDYFDTPWSTISFFAAFVLLVLTFLQTIYTIQPYYHPRG
ncbi:hypothetical protein RchiOBHm_Chr2g0175171 [Rosa chinensis]|uniref:DUF247 domain protein n=1 Tax=Rosa chinensis TaxID=74649 RepID=A0A2P6S6B9_ROSCH|nr:UPF0481 protein At3g47200 [Rosa chinensis]PRQ54226.1 hypothetical protein RchiOBHm_Chr2g0175171 [Rosa chinensis]